MKYVIYAVLAVLSVATPPEPQKLITPTVVPSIMGTTVEPEPWYSVPEPVSEPAPAVSATDCATEILKYDWNQTAAYNVMVVESGNRPWVVNNNSSTLDYSVGCFQINLYGGNARTRPSEEWLVDASNNVSYAYGMWKSQGTFCKTSGWYSTCTKLGYHGIF